MKLAEIFTDHMVFQAEKEIRIFGSGVGTGFVQFLGKRYNIDADSDKWFVTIPPYGYGGPYEMEIVLEDKHYFLSNIYIGEVWFVSGQSNMEMPLYRVENGFDDAKAAQDNLIRLYSVPKRVEKNTPSYGWHFEKTFSHNTSWSICNEKTALHFSAIGYYVAEFLRKNLGVALGIIACDWCGTPIETFIGRDYFYGNPVLEPIINEHNELVRDIGKEKEISILNNDLKKFEEYCKSIDYDEVERAREIGLMATSAPPKELLVYSPGRYNPCAPACLYESMIEPILPYVFKGIIWYQGEANSGEGYLEKLQTFIHCMRTVFNDDTLPFHIIELASFCVDGQDDVSDRFVTAKYNWAFVREAQYKMAKSDSYTYVTTNMGLGDLYDIHPPRKKELSRRLVKKILRHTYNRNIFADQPEYEAMEIIGSEVNIKLKIADGLFSDNRGAVKIYIAGNDRVLKRASVKICGDSLVLSSDDVAKPVLARFAFDYCYKGCNLYNSAGLPLAPFRTDCL